MRRFLRPHSWWESELGSPHAVWLQRPGSEPLASPASWPQSTEGEITPSVQEVMTS